MYKPPQINTYLQTKPKKLLPKTLLTFFLISEFAFGINLGFSNLFSGTKKRVARFFSLIIALCMLTFLTIEIRFGYSIWYWCSVFEYASLFIILNSAAYKVYNFIEDLEATETDPKISHKSIFGIIILLYTLIMVVAKEAIVIVRCVFHKEIYCLQHSVLDYVIYCLPSVSVDMVPAALITIYFYVLCAMKSLKENLQPETDLRLFSKRFIHIADVYDKIRLLYDKIIIVELMILMPKLMSTMWFSLVFIKQNEGWFPYISEWVFAFHLSLQVTIPAALAESTNSEADKIMVALNERLLNADASQKAYILRLLEYMRSRQLQYKVFRVIPVDLRLPLSLISICTTYFIVILQFTHLYD